MNVIPASQAKVECAPNTGCIRRHTFGGAKQDFRSSAVKSATLSGPAAYETRSSDSDDHEEQLFVPNRVAGRNENGYEADTDH